MNTNKIQYRFMLALWLCSSIYLQSYAQASLHEKKINQQVQTFFKGLNAKDTVQLKSTLAANASLKSLLIKNEEEQLVSEEMGEFIKQLGRIPEDLTIREEVENIKIHLRFPLADVFTDYTFFVNGEKSHSGINLFTFAYMNKEWKIVNIVDTRQ